MTWRDVLRTAVRGILGRKLRSALTALGVTIGIAAVMATVGIGLGAQQQVESEINKLGSQVLVVNGGGGADPVGRGGPQSDRRAEAVPPAAEGLSLQDAQTLEDKRVAPDVEGVAPILTTHTSVHGPEKPVSMAVVGTTTAWPNVRSREVLSGRFFSTEDVQGAAKVAVLGPRAAQHLKLSRAVGSVIKVGGTELTVVGVLRSVGSSTSQDEDRQVIIPHTTYSDVMRTASPSLSLIYVKAASEDALPAAYQEVQAALAAAKGVNAESATFTVASQASLVRAATSASKTFAVLLGGIAAISLLVGGIGVMNIMLVSVTERTREIGVRKALGARPVDIRGQFLVEAAVLGLVGGVMGLALGMAVIFSLPRFIDQPVAISGAAAASAVLISLVVGIIAGVYPAMRAARLTPIQALRSTV